MIADTGTFACDAHRGRRQSVSTPAVREYGPCTLYDLDALPEDRKGYELAAEVRAGHVLAVQEPFPVSFDPVALTELD
jgi:hypothetical protein